MIHNLWPLFAIVLAVLGPFPNFKNILKSLQILPETLFTAKIFIEECIYSETAKRRKYKANMSYIL